MKIYFILFVYLLSNAMCFAKDTRAEELFNTANQSYISKQYTTAVSQYEELINAGYKTAEIYFNLGNSYFKTGNYARAILNYERANLINPGNDDIEFNLAKARTYIIDKIDVIPDFFIKTWFKGLVGILSSDKWATLALLLFVVTSGSFLLFFFISRMHVRRILIYTAVITILFSLLSLIFSYKTKAYIERSNAAIVVEPTGTAKSSPDNESSDVFIIHEGTKVFILRSLNGWHEIKLSDGKQGWIDEKSIEKI